MRRVAAKALGERRPAVALDGQIKLVERDERWESVAAASWRTFFVLVRDGATVALADRHGCRPPSPASNLSGRQHTEPEHEGEDQGGSERSALADDHTRVDAVPGRSALSCRRAIGRWSVPIMPVG